MSRGAKNTFKSLSRGFKQVVGHVRRGIKHVPAAIRKADKFATGAANFLDNAGQYAQLAAIDTGNQKIANFGDKLQTRDGEMRSRQGHSQLAKRLRSDFR